MSTTSGVAASTSSAAAAFGCARPASSRRSAAAGDGQCGGATERSETSANAASLHEWHRGSLAQRHRRGNLPRPHLARDPCREPWETYRCHLRRPRVRPNHGASDLIWYSPGVNGPIFLALLDGAAWDHARDEVERNHDAKDG